MGAFDDLIPDPAPDADAFADLIPQDAGAFADLVPPGSPQAPGTAAPGTVPLADPYGNSTAPTHAAAPAVTPFISALLGLPPAAAPTAAPAASDPSLLPLVSGETPAAPVGPAGALTPLPPPTPEARDASTGFLNNLSVRDLLTAPQKGAAAGAMKYLTGNTDAEVAKRRRALGQDTDPIEREFNAALEATYQAGGYESPDYQRLDQAFAQYKAVRDKNPDFDWGSIKAAYQADPGGFWAEMAKTVAADPELLATPLGWRTLAGRLGGAAVAVGAGRAVTAAAKVAGGVVGSAATGAAITAPVSVGVQLGETGTVDAGRTARETAIGAVASGGTAGLFVGLGAGVRSLRKLKTRPGVDPAAVDAEIAELMQRTEAEAVRAGASPEEARAQVERFAVDVEPTPEGRAVVRPRTEILDQLPGEPTHTMPDGTEMPGATHGEAPAAPADMAAVDDEIGTLLRRTPEEPPETIRTTPADLEDRLVKARQMAARSRNGDIKTEWEVTIADLEEQIARAGRETTESFKLREPGPDELPTDQTRTATETGRGAVSELSPELYLPDRAPAAEHVAATAALGPGVRHVRTGTFPSALQKVTRADDVAHATAPLRREAQEAMLAVATDAQGQVLRIARLFKGTGNEAAVDPGLVAGAMASTPGAKRAWFVHNHPSGKPVQTDADRVLTERLHELLRGSGIEPQGMVALAPGGRFTHFRPGATDATGEAVAAIPAGRRTERLPVTERQLAGRTEPSTPIDTPERLRAAVGEREGILLLDNEKRALRFVPLTAEEMARLRQGEGGASQRLLAAIDDTPTTRAFAARTSAKGDEAQRVAGNLDGFARVHGTPLVDVIDGAGESLGGRGGIPEQSTFYANPFLYAVGKAARDIGRHTGRNLTAGAAGGALAGVSSDEEAGSAKWWVDVAAGATAGVVGSQFLRSTRLLGKGSIVDNWRGRVGTWIDSLPLIGRGPAELRDLKRKQRLMQDYLDRQTAEVGKQLLNNFSPSERAMMADLIETRGIVKDLNVIHRQAQALDDYLAYAARKMKELGMLPLDLEEGGYLHRYYAKHLGLDKQFREAKGQSLSGSYTIARGTDDVFGREYLSPGAGKVVDEFEKLRDSAKVLSADRARLRALSKIEFIEYRGLQDGKIRSFLFTQDEVPRVDTGTKPVLAQLNKTSAPAKGTEAGAPRRPGDVTDLKPTNYRWTVRGTKGKEALLHRDWTKYERQSWGEIEDAGYRYTRGMIEVAHDLSLATLFDTVWRKADWTSSTPRTTNGKPWVQVPTTGVGKNSPLQKYGALAGKYVRPDIWAGLKGYGRNPLRGGPEIPLTGVGVGDAYLAALNKWKLYKTVYNPVTHFNNTYSNVEMLYQGGYSPADLGRGIKHLRQGEQSAVWKEARDAGLFGSDWTTSILGGDGRGNQVLADLAEKLRTQPEIPDATLVTSLVMDLKHWWVNSKQSVAAADGAWKTGAEVALAMGKPVLAGVGFTLKPVKIAGRVMQRAYQFEDNLFKMAVFAAERKKGLTPDQAVNEANKLFFDYQDLPEGLKLVRDLPVGAPFISYPYFAVQAIARNVAQNPERVLMLVAGYEALNYAVLTSQGMAPGEYWATESAEDATSPPWDRGRALWGARNTVHMPFLEGYRVALGRAHAMGNPFMTEAGGREKLPQMPAGGGVWGSSVFGGNPLHALLDVSVNEDWKGKEIYKPGAPAEEKAQKIAAYLYQAWAPSNIVTPGGYQQTKVLEGLANNVRKARAEGKDPGVIGPVVDAANATAEAIGFGQFTGLDRAENEIVTRDALLASFGVKLRPIRVEQSVEFETGKLEREKQKAAAWFRGKVRENADGRITDAQLEAHEAQYDAAIDRLDAGQDKLFDAEQFLQKPKPPR